MISINEQEQKLFHEWSKFLNVTMDEFVSDGLFFHDGLMFKGANWVRTSSGNNTENWALQILSVDSPRKSVSQISSCNGTLFKIIV